MNFTEPIRCMVMDMDRMKTRKLVAWFIMAALGLFDAKGQTADNPTFSVWQLLFGKATIFLENSQDKKLIIKTENNAAENVFV